MDIEKLKAEFEQSECFKKLEHVAQYTFFEFGAYLKRTDVPDNVEKKCGHLITALIFSWGAWKEAKAQSDEKIKLLLCDEHLQKCESPTGIFNSQYPDEEPCLICLAKEAKANTVPEGFVLVPHGVLDLTRFMCKTWSEIDKFVYKNCSDIGQYPVIQGTQNQLNLSRIGEQQINANEINKGVNWLLEAAQEPAND